MVTLEMPPSGSGPARLTLDGELVIQGISELRSKLIETLDGLPGNIPIEVDLSEVESIDTAGVQALVGMLRHVQSRGGYIEITHHSPSTFNATEVFGLQDTLGVGRI